MADQQHKRRAPDPAPVSREHAEWMEAIAELARCLRFISMGEREPAGLELLAIAIAGKADVAGDNLSGSVRQLADEAGRIADAMERMAAAMEGKNGR